MATTNGYIHLAGVVFRDEADALERRLGLSTEPSTDLTASEHVSANGNTRSEAATHAADVQ